MEPLTEHKHEIDPDHCNLFQSDFKVRTRTNRLFGLWVAELLGLNAENAAQYVEELLMLDLRQGANDLLEKVQQDLLDANILMTESHLQDQVDQFWSIATETLTEH